MYVTLTIARYPPWFGWAGFKSMALFRMPMWLNKNIGFYKLLGCGKNGTFDKTPDLNQWGILAVLKNDDLINAWISTGNNDADLQPLHKKIYGGFITRWWQIFNCETFTYILQPLEGHGTWDGKYVFGSLPKNSDHEGPVGVLTRATLRLNKLGRFWSHVDAAASSMASSPGFITSLGVGEIPWIKQATFSVWQSKTAMKDFAYKMKDHAEIIKKTRQEKWYSEDMFTRFKIVKALGTIKGVNPLKGML